MASKDSLYGSFRRGERREGGKHGSYAKNVSKNAAQKSKAILNSSVKDVLFCLLVPPYGVYRVWTRKKALPVFRIACTALAMLIVFLWFLLIIPESKPDAVEVAKVKATASQQ